MLKWLFVVLGALALLVVAVVVALPWFLNTKGFQAYLAQSATHALGRTVTFATVSIAPFPLPTVKLRDVEVADDPEFRSGPFLNIREGRMGIRLKALLSGRMELADLVLEEPTVTVVEDERGRWNWASLGTPGPSPASTPRSGGRVGGGAGSALLLSRVSIVGGRVQYGKVGMKSDLQLDKISLKINQTSPGAGFRFQGSAMAQPGNVKLTFRDASLTPTASRSLGEMALRATVDVAASDIAGLGGALRISRSVTGTMEGRFEVLGTPLHLAATGAARSDRLVATVDRPQCDPRRRQLVMSDLRVPIAYNEGKIDSVPLQAKVAGGNVTLRLSLALGLEQLATLEDIKVVGVQLGPILVDFMCQPDAVTGPMNLEGEANLRLDDPWRTVTGSGRLRIGPGKIVGKDIVNLVNEVVSLADVAGTMANSERRDRRGAPLDFTSITATYTITDGVAKTNDLLYESPDLRVLATGTFRLADERVDMAVTLTQGRNEVKGVVTGALGSLHVAPTEVRVPDTTRIKKFLDKLLR